MEKDLVLGLDIGTSSIKLILLNIKTNVIELDLKRSSLLAKIKTSNDSFDEQSTNFILNLVTEMFNDVSAEYLARIKAIQVCGQVFIVF
jgi:sugar (pentulose or hexulose) kinase